MASHLRTSPRGRASLIGVAAVFVLALLGFASPAAASQPSAGTALSPNHAPAACGIPIEITGTDLHLVTGVKIGTQDATITSKSPTMLVVICPAGPAGATYEVVITSAEGSTQNLRFRYDEEFRPPIATSLSPDHGPAAGGDRVTIVGKNLAWTTEVRFGTKSAVVVAKSLTTLEVNVPPGQEGTVVDVHVTNPDGTSSPLTYEYDHHVDRFPSISGVSPSTGPASGGTRVVVTGVFLDPLVAVRFGDQVIPAADVRSKSPTSVEFITPPHAPGKIDIVLLTPPRADPRGSGRRLHGLARPARGTGLRRDRCGDAEVAGPRDVLRRRHG